MGELSARDSAMTEWVIAQPAPSKLNRRCLRFHPLRLAALPRATSPIEGEENFC
jgi:hypothetical protein